MRGAPCFGDCTVLISCQTAASQPMTTETLQQDIAATSGWIQDVKDEMARVLAVYNDLSRPG